MPCTVSILHQFTRDPSKKEDRKVTFLTSLLDLNACGIKESLSIASISFTRFTCSTRLDWSVEEI